MIMPVIFILTALLDLWVPKEKIMHYLGKNAKLKGAFLSLLLGSISAGPIYAAFPLCGMLHKKGASIRNLVIILSAWAVIKIPMLLNEAAFLGVWFMFTRWILTLIAILIFSWITQKLVNDDDLPVTDSPRAGLTINRSACMGCSLCAKTHPDLVEMQAKNASLKEIHTDLSADRLSSLLQICPVKAISFQSFLQ
jgi:uncharacterized membrane protein YraQ (UPF0718 family)